MCPRHRRRLPTEKGNVPIVHIVVKTLQFLRLIENDQGRTHMKWKKKEKILEEKKKSMEKTHRDVSDDGGKGGAHDGPVNEPGCGGPIGLKQKEIQFNKYKDEDATIITTL